MDEFAENYDPSHTIMDNPDGSLAFWMSIIPFTSPVVMMVRLPFGVANSN